VNERLDSRTAYAMWGLGVLAYISAILTRTSFGIAGVQAAERFAIGASTASLFVVVQLITYAAMQVPVGLLADRFGTRLVVSCGAVLMCAGQLTLAFTTVLPLAIAARVLVGAGDALTFIAVLRLLPAWFSAGRLPVLNQVTSLLGQVGQLLSSIPLAAVLLTFGWTAAFSTAAAASAGVAVLVGAFLRDAPPGGRTTTAGGASPWQQVRAVLRVPASRVGFWVHWASSIWGLVFPLMWGYPFLINGLGHSPAVAAALLTVFVFATAPLGIGFGMLSRRAPGQRVNLALLVTLLAAVPWSAVLLWPGQPPLWLLVVLMIGIAGSGPGAAISFDIVRSGNPLPQLATASGFVIVGGFFAGLVTILGVGVVLDHSGGYSMGAFRWAMAAQFVLWAIGVVGMYTTRAGARRLDRRRGVRYSSLRSLLGRVIGDAVATLRPGARRPRPIGSLALALGVGRTVHVAAVLPGTGGRLVAVDVPPEGRDDSWWRHRVGDYLEIVDTPELQVGAVEVRCPNRAETVRVRRLIDSALTGDDEALTVEVRTMAR